MQQSKIIRLPEKEQAPKHNLPVQLTSLLGREQEVEAVCALLRRPEVRLLTLTGTGGVGKTRLALQIAEELRDDFADGVSFVSLAPLSDPELVVPTITQTLGLKEMGNQSLLDLLKAYLRNKPLLLVLDNFEQIVTAAPLLVELLQTCPHLQILVTSRTLLRVSGEHEFWVPPLAVPNLKQLPAPEAFSQYAAVALFLQRAQALKPDFHMTATNAQTIAEICVRLDGLPLAIELAAARIKLLSPQALLMRLSQRLQVLTSGSRDAPARQQTLRNTIEWSYQLLDATEQRLFRRLSIFVGGCTLEAVEALCAALDGETGQVLDGVASLIDKNLLQQMEQEEEEPRLRMLEMIREYALEVLKASGELETTQQAHAGYYLSLAEQTEAELEGSRQVRCFERLEREYDNLRAALTWALEPGLGEEGERRKELALRLGGALGEFWMLQSHLSEGRTFLEQAIAASPRAASVPLAKALSAAADLALVQSDKRAEALAEEGLALYQQLGDQAGIASCLHVLGIYAMWRGEDGQAHPLLQESAELYRALGNKYQLAWSLVLQGVTDQAQGEHVGARAHYEEALALFSDLGIMVAIARMRFFLGRLLFYCQGDALTARSFLEEASRSFREEGDTAGVAISLLRSAEVALLGQGNLAAAEVQAEESLGFYSELNYKGGMAEALFVLARVQARQGNYSAARSRYEDILTLAREGDDMRNIHIAFRVENNRERPRLPSKGGYNPNLPFYLEGLAEVVAAQGEGAWAGHLWGAAEAMREDLTTPLPAVFRTEYERAVTAARTQVGEKTFAAAWAEGRRMTLEQALTARRPETIPTLVSIEQPLTRPAKPSPAYPDSLTEREVEILRLVAQGLTNPQIADQLIVSSHTVNAHMRSIFNKLGVSSRSAATAYALAHNLV